MYRSEKDMLAERSCLGLTCCDWQEARLAESPGWQEGQGNDSLFTSMEEQLKQTSHKTPR